MAASLLPLPSLSLRKSQGYYHGPWDEDSLRWLSSGGMKWRADTSTPQKGITYGTQEVHRKKEKKKIEWCVPTPASCLHCKMTISYKNFHFWRSVCWTFVQQWALASVADIKFNMESNYTLLFYHMQYRVKNDSISFTGKSFPNVLQRKETALTGKKEVFPSNNGFPGSSFKLRGKSWMTAHTSEPSMECAEQRIYSVLSMMLSSSKIMQTRGSQMGMGLLGV